MRLLRLQAEGFACFKDRQELDLSSLDLFAITGPTGAGKSSLLDAMLFALYGVIPRVGAQNHDELISHGRPRMAVTLDFRIGGRVFRVTRARGRKGPAQAQLEELRDGAERPVADGVNTVEAEIRKRLGLSYDAFAQAVVLPQGEFMRFLKPDSPGKRRGILRDLLRLGVYERMRQRASERASQLEQRVSELDRRLREDYAGATPEALATLRESHTEVVQDLLVATAELQQGRRTLDALRLVQALAVDLAARRTELRRLTARAPEIAAAEARVEAARRAAPVIALAKAADESCRRAETLATRLAEAVEARTRAEATHAEARQRLAGAEAAGAAIAPLRDRLRQLDEVVGLVQARGAAHVRQASAGEERERFLSDHRSAVVKAQAAGARAETLARALGEADERLREIRYDAELAAPLDAVRDAATALAALRRHALSLEAAALRAEEAAQAAATAVARRQKEAEEAARQHSNALRRLEAVDLAWHQTERAHRALVLRRELKPGEPCPVCAQPVTVVPEALAPPELERLVRDRETVRTAEAHAREAAEASRLAAARAEASAVEMGRASDQAWVEAGRANGEVATAEQSLAAAAGALVADEPGPTLEARVAECARRLAARRAEHEHAVTAWQQAERELQAAQHEAMLATQRAEDLGRQADAAGERATEAQAEVARLDGEIKRVTEDPDPLAERERVAAEYDRLVRELDAARRDEATAAAAFAATVAAHEAARRAAEEAADAASFAQGGVRQQAREAGFPDDVAARAAILESTEIERLTRETEAHRRELHAVERRVTELTSELGGRHVTDDEVRGAVGRVAEQQQAVETLQRREAQMEHEIEALAERVARAETLACELATARADHALQRRLADDLRNERFQAFVLEETFRELAAGASERLRQLSGRYTLEFADDTFVVVDHDNAGERRSADTLSGGETFLTSLALALELSEQVQRAAGAVPLDSLFIDEGFGTLDPETLGTVADAIATLPLGGRMVGIITHVRELAESLPARVIVEKRSDGSRLRIHLE
jgi:DNA repair protein SbcC/Rad50